jgi:pimeloyl-ACP methyl ester carboxylesterase
LPDSSASWLDRVESTRARLWLLGSVLPRAVASSRAAGRRTPESGIPAWDLGLREFGETATDELFIALSALYREVPDLDSVRASAEACADAAPELTALGVAGAHRDPPPLTILGLRRRKVAGIRYEHLEFASRPDLPGSLRSAGYGAVEVAHARVLRHRGGPRPWVVWIHGAEQGRVDDLFAFRAKHLHHELGLNVVLPVLPHHGPRRDLGHAWPGFDLLGNIATMIRAVSDVRTVIGWIDDQGPASLAVVGMSLGGPVAALTAGLDERVDAVAATVPMLDAHATIAHHTAKTGGRGRRLAALLRSEPVRAVGTVVDPTALEPHCAPDRRLVVAALGDRMTSVNAAQRLHARWDGQVYWHPGGHIGHLMSGGVRAVIDDFLLEGRPTSP